MILVSPAGQRLHRNDAGHDTCRFHPHTGNAVPPSCSVSSLNLVAVSDELLMPGASGVSIPPDDVEIVTVVLEGEVELGTCIKHRTLSKAGTAHWRPSGTGHAFHCLNPSPDTASHILQFWLTAPTPGSNIHEAGEHAIPLCPKNPWLLLASPDGRGGSLPTSCGVRLWLGRFRPGQRLRHPLTPGKASWLQVIGGLVHCNGVLLAAGASATLRDEAHLRLMAKRPSLVFLADHASDTPSPEPRRLFQ